MLESKDRKRNNVLTITDDNSVEENLLTGQVELDQFHKIIRMFGLHVFQNPLQLKKYINKNNKTGK